MESPCFAFPGVDDFLAAFAPPHDQAELIRALADKGLPPIVSTEALATMLGLNPGLIWSFVNRPHRYYDSFTIPKGHGERLIHAPRVALKVVQKWLSHHLARAYAAPEHVFGFVPGRSHIGAALVHAKAEWAFSVDITDFFPSTPQDQVQDAYRYLGYDHQTSQLLGALSCFRGGLAQGAPTSPPLSNICFRHLDARLGEIARQFDARVTRYADDIVFSGPGILPVHIPEVVHAVFAGTPWILRADKTRVEPLKGRIKIHGLLVRDGRVRLTKGYRNQLRAYAHVLRTKENPQHLEKLVGHIEYAKHVAEVTGQGLDAFLLDIPRRQTVRELEDSPPGDTARRHERADQQPPTLRGRLVSLFRRVRGGLAGLPR